MDATEIARLREIAQDVKQPTRPIVATSKTLTAFFNAFDPPTVLSLLADLKQAQKDAQAARALLVECDSELPDTRPARSLRARIEAMLEQKP